MSFSYWVNEVADIPMQREDGTWYDAETGFDYSEWRNQEEKVSKPKYVPSDKVQAHRAYAKQFGGKALTGTDKQKNWAEKIRAEKLAQVSDNLAAKMLTVIYPAESAKFWIENRDKPASQMAAYAGRYMSAVKGLNRVAALIEQVHVNDKTRNVVRNKPLYELHRQYAAMLESSSTDFNKFGDAELSELEQKVEQANKDFADAATVLNAPKPKAQQPVKPKKGETQEDQAVREALQAMDSSDDPMVQLTACVKALYAINARGSAQFDSIDFEGVNTDLVAIDMMFDGVGDIQTVTDSDIQADPLAVLDLCVGLLEESTDAITPTGRANPVKTAKGTKVGTQFAVVEVEKLITSHDSAGNENPAFPQELQPRDRGRDASRAWVSKVANSLDPDSLGRTSRADSGAPIVGRDGIVESGNGRTMAIRMAYDQGTADEYREFLISDADYFGIDPDQVERMKRPVLVRVRTTEIDRRVFTVEANQDDKLALSATERARSDSKRLDANMLALFKPDENGSLLTLSNHKFIQAFLASLGDAEAAQYVTKGGKPTRALVDRIRAAVFSKAYNDDRLLEMMADDANPDLQNVLNALGAASSKFIEAQAFGRAAVEDTATAMVDGIEQSLDERVTSAVIEATNTLLSARANNQDVTEYVRQQGLFEDIDDGVAALAVFLAQNSRSAKRMAIAFKAMAEYVKNDAINQTNNGLFGEPVPPSLIDVVAAANIQLEQEYGSDARGIGLFDSVNPDIKYITDADTQNDPLSVLDACIDFIANVAKGKKNAAKAIEEDDLSFETVADAMLWVELEAKKQGISVSRFTSTPAYHAIYPKIAALQKKEKEARNANLMARFNNSGLKSGDRVQTTVVGLGGAVADVYTGIVKIVSGKPTVYLNQMMTVSRNGRLHDTKKLTWSNQWQKASDSHGFDSFLADGRYDHIHLDDLQMHPYANAAKERQPTANTPLLVQKNRRGDLYLIAGVKRYEMALDDDLERLPAVILPVIEGYGDPVIKRVLNAYTGSIDPLALMAAIEDAVVARAGRTLA